MCRLVATKHKKIFSRKRKVKWMHLTNLVFGELSPLYMLSMWKKMERLTPRISVALVLPSSVKMKAFLPV